MNPASPLPDHLLTALSGSLLHFALLLLGGGMLAALSLELVDQQRDQHGCCLRAGKFTSSLWLWVLLLYLLGAGLSYYPRRAELFSLNPASISFLSGMVAVAMLLIYHFTSKIIKIRILHLLPGLIALGLSFFVIYLDCLAGLPAAWQSAAAGMKSCGEACLWWLRQDDLFQSLQLCFTALGAAMLWFMILNAGEKEGRRRQNREYYFTAAAWAGKWLLLAILLALLPLGRDFYLAAGGRLGSLLAPPLAYWLGATLLCYLLGFLLLLKITLDGLVNRRATLIITFFLVLGLAAQQCGGQFF